MPGLFVFSKLPPGTVGTGVEPAAGVDGGVHTGIVQHVGSRGSGCSVHRSWSRPKNVGHLQCIYRGVYYVIHIRRFPLRTLKSVSVESTILHFL